MFISFEGIDGCGKTTQIVLLQARLQSEGKTVLLTREPGGTSLAEAMREVLLHSKNSLSPPAELLLFGASRAQHVEEIIRPALARGEVVLCDRFADSSVAYQGGGLGLDADFIRRMNDFATQELHPEVTFLFDLDPQTGLTRRAVQRGESPDRIEARGIEFQNRVRAAYLQLAQAEPKRIVLLDAAPPAKVVHERLVKALRARGLFPNG